MKNNLYLPIFLWILLVLFLASPALAQKENKLNQDDIDYYKEKMIRKTNIVGKIFRLIGARNNLEKNMPTYMRKLNQIFEEPESPIYHIFIFENEKTKAYPYNEFVAELINPSIEYANVNWQIVGWPFVVPDGKNERRITPSTINCVFNSNKEKAAT